MALIPWTTYHDWEPFTRLRTIQDQFNRLFEDTFESYPLVTKEGLERKWLPLVDIYEDKDSFVVQAELPGVKKEDVTIEIKDTVLTLSGERRHEEETKKENYHRIERTYGKFTRSFTLPGSVKVEGVRAQYKDGVLEIRLPKAEKAKPKSIPIEVK